MSRHLTIRPEAETDLAEIFEWYEGHVSGPGLEFIRTVDSLFNSIIRNPQAYPVFYRTVRRAFTRKFPYEIFFEQTMPASLFSRCSTPSVIRNVGQKESDTLRVLWGE